MNTLTISAVAFEEAGVWVVQGIEFDICAHTKDPAGIPAAFMRAVAENARITRHLGRGPLEGIGPAPQRFKAMFDEALTEVRSVRPRESAEAPVSVLDIRLAGHA